MDVSALHAATEDLAGYLSEVTVGDLHRPTPSHPQGIGELIEKILEDNVRLAAEVRRRLGVPDADSDRTGQPHEVPAAEPGHRIIGLGAAPDLLHGGGFEIGYRRTAAMVEEAFAAAPDSAAEIAELYRQYVTATHRYVRDVTAALGLD
jgi:hypothetical protein